MNEIRPTSTQRRNPGPTIGPSGAGISTRACSASRSSSCWRSAGRSTCSRPRSNRGSTALTTISRSKDHPATAADQIRAALAAVPGSTLNAYEVPEAADSAARVIVNRDGEATRVYVHPESLQGLKTVAEDDRFMRSPVPAPRRAADGQSRLGRRGAGGVVGDHHDRHRAVPLVARGAKGLRGVVYPRLGSRLAGVLARHPRRHRLLDLRPGPLPAVQRPALGEVLGRLPQDRATAHRHGGGPAGLDERGSLDRGDPIGAAGSGEHGDHRCERSGRGGADAADSERPRPPWTGSSRRSARSGWTRRWSSSLPPRGSSDWTAKSMTPNRPRGSTSWSTARPARSRTARISRTGT